MLYELTWTQSGWGWSHDTFSLAYVSSQRNGDDQKSTSADTTSVVERTLDRVAGDEIHDFHKFILSCASSWDHMSIMFCTTFFFLIESVHDDDLDQPCQWHFHPTISRISCLAHLTPDPLVCCCTPEFSHAGLCLVNQIIPWVDLIQSLKKAAASQLPAQWSHTTMCLFPPLLQRFLQLAVSETVGHIALTEVNWTQERRSTKHLKHLTKHGSNCWIYFIYLVSTRFQSTSLFSPSNPYLCSGVIL